MSHDLIVSQGVKRIVSFKHLNPITKTFFDSANAIFYSLRYCEYHDYDSQPYARNRDHKAY